jgi:hypothetical protein
LFPKKEKRKKIKKRKCVLRFMQLDTHVHIENFRNFANKHLKKQQQQKTPPPTTKQQNVIMVILHQWDLKWGW